MFQYCTIKEVYTAIFDLEFYYFVLNIVPFDFSKEIEESKK